MAAVSGTSQPKSSNRIRTGNLSNAAGEITTRSRAGKRDEKKKDTEPEISIPMSTVKKLLENQHFSSDFMYLSSVLEKNLPYLGATEAETAKLMNSFKRAQDELLAGEAKFLKVIQTDGTQIQLDISAMGPVCASAIQQFQNDIRSTLSGDAAELLISSINWNQFYPVDKESSPVLKMIRRTSGEVMGTVAIGDIVKWYRIYGNVADDGTPIPADQGFEDRWKLHLKGLTLQPQNEK
ncbi:MAG: hypothetical protein V4689_14635 [Verrucomicrobiota bacterium]